MLYITGRIRNGPTPWACIAGHDTGFPPVGTGKGFLSSFEYLTVEVYACLAKFALPYPPTSAFNWLFADALTPAISDRAIP